MKRAASAPISALLITLMLVASFPSLKAVSEAPQPQWSKTYGPYRGKAMVQTFDGGYAIAGGYATYGKGGWGGYKPLLIKTNLSGELEWQKTYGPEFGIEGEANSIVQTKDLGYILSTGDRLLKTDDNGILQWNKTFGSGLNFNIIQTSDGGYLLFGYRYTGYNIGTLHKTDENGDLIWNKTYSSGSLTPTIWIRDALETDDRSYIVAGTWEGDFWLAKIDSSGGLLWNQTYHYFDNLQSSPQTFNSVAKTSDGGYILSGEDGGSAWLFKTDAVGNEEWHRSYIGGESDTGFGSAMEISNGKYVVAGAYDSLALLVGFDSSGNYLWNATYGGTVGESNGARSVIVTNDGGFAVAGSLDNNVWLAKFAPETATPPDNSSPDRTSPPFPATWIVAAVIILAVVGIGLLVYLKKRKR